MARHRLLRPVVVVSLGLIACDIAILPSADPLPVIQGVLVVGEHGHGISVTWSVPSDSSFEFQGPARPIAPQEVSLRLLLPGGASAPVVSTNPVRGQFEVLADILPNTGYGLTGTVAGRAISASVVTPGLFLISLPAGDTVRLINAGIPSRQVPYLWHASGAVGYLAKPFEARILATSDSTGTLNFILSFSDTTSLTLMALERHATEFFLPNVVDRRRGNISGALGALGAASTARRVFIWQ